MSTTPATSLKAVKPYKLRKAAAIYRLLKRVVKGKSKSPYWQVRIRLARGKYKQRSSNTTHRKAAREFALLWIKEDFPQLCPALDIKPLVKPRLEATPPPRSVTPQTGRRYRPRRLSTL